MMKLWGRASSSNVQAVCWALLELGRAHDRVDVGEGFGGLETPAFREMNPMGKIPVLQDGDVTLFESAAILRYLARVYGGATFWPEGLKERSRVDMWAEWAKWEVANAFTGPIFWRVVRTPEARRDAGAIRAALSAFEDALAVAETRLRQHDWLAGPHMTPGDIHFGHVLYRYYDMDVPRRDLPAVAAYYQKLSERPAYRTAVMLNYDALRNTI